MAVGELLQSVTALAATCAKHVSRAAKKLRINSSSIRIPTSPILARGASFIPFLTSKKRINGEHHHHVDAEKNNKKKKEENSWDSDDDDDEEEDLWRRTILMGGKCQPLDFSGVICYDSDGRLLSEPRSPLRSPLPSFMFRPAAGGVMEREFAK